ncbi:MAG TPA: DUF3108 domain-containing protein [Candidatus Brocadiales bacterium]|nr:DUF3108 domain-containing protein [Candidatus Brocadiales bacterium]
MFFKIQKGSLTGLNKPRVTAAFFVLSLFLVHIYFLSASVSGGLADDASSLQQAGRGPVEVREYKLSYDIGFWIFQRIGVGTAMLERMDKPATYTVTLEAHPVGIFASIVKRQMIYQTVMELDKNSNRLRPLCSSQKRIKGKETRDKTIKFDYEKGMCTFEYRKNGVLEKEKTISIPSKLIPEDAVTAFHNFCNGVYGEVNEGSRYNIKIMVKERPSNLSLEVCSTDGRKEFPLQENKEKALGFVAKINLDPEIVESNKGEIFVSFSSDSTPLAVKVKDVIGYGDLYGHLTTR